MLKKKFGNNIQLLCTDADFLMDEVCSDDFYQDMCAMKEQFDLASYPNSSTFFDANKNKVVGKFMDEASGQSSSEFEGMKHKMYLYKTLNDPSHVKVGFTTTKRAKGYNVLR